MDVVLANGAPLTDPTPAGTIPQKAGPKDWNRLYHQNPDGTFEDVTEKAGLAGAGYDMGVAVGDYDNDGYEDLYVTGKRREPSLPQQRQWLFYRRGLRLPAPAGAGGIFRGVGRSRTMGGSTWLCCGI